MMEYTPANLHPIEITFSIIVANALDVPHPTYNFYRVTFHIASGGWKVFIRERTAGAKRFDIIGIYTEVSEETARNLLLDHLNSPHGKQ